MFAYQYASPYPYRTSLGPFQSNGRPHSLEEEYLQDLYYQHLIEEEKKHRAASLQHALYAAYEREQIKRAQELAYRKQLAYRQELAYRKELAHRKELAYQKEMAERRRRQYIENYESYQNRILNHLIGNLLADNVEEKEEEEENNTSSIYCRNEFENGNCRKKARRSYQNPEPSQQEEQEQVWLLLHHLKALDTFEAEKESKPVEGRAQNGKTHKSELQQVNAETGESSTSKASSNDNRDEETYSKEDIDKTFTALNVISTKLDRIQEQHESQILASPLTFENESEEILARTTSNKHFLTYEDDIMKVLLELDAITSHGLPEIRNKRKELVNKSEKLLKVIDDHKQKEWERASSSSSHDSDEETEVPETEKSNLNVSEDSAFEAGSTAFTVEAEEDTSASEAPAINQRSSETSAAQLAESISLDVNHSYTDSELSPIQEDTKSAIKADYELPLSNTENGQDQEIQVNKEISNGSEAATNSLISSSQDDEGSPKNDHDNEVSNKAISEDGMEEDDGYEHVHSKSQGNGSDQTISQETEEQEEHDFDMVDHIDVPNSDFMEEMNESNSPASSELSSDRKSGPHRIEIEWSD